MMIEEKQNLDVVREYYTDLRPAYQADETIYAIWERGGAFNDSVTPSTYVPEYRSHILLKLMSLTEKGASVLSLGCGNGFVEGDLAAQERSVRAIDVNEEAVELTRKKGVDAFVADYYALRPEDVAGADAVYADGFLGHLFDAGDEIRPALRKLVSLNLKSGAHLVFSNDAPFDRDAAFEPHQRVQDFWFLSKDYLQESLASFGFSSVESYYFPYLRPISGMRNRTICVVRVP
ncbi:class I SAM-dependent methyltransferase [Streptomyces halobius]|uniref:Class I SAM-dependent methyltransferase n=1 Tax=Streptomyces halobius TaxID=2879846 RepID=A0ABY4MG30_9ACTN|nr:class I SAM-dependent methyltransferase [Streptomyces halobius]UQA95669.1 class I SAM-dependent methyltransferase [Streptomyces halobius]